MKLQEQIAKHFREIHFGTNWTWSNMKEHLSDVTWEQAVTVIPSFNTIATLVYHVHYYVDRVLSVLDGNPLEAHDSDSFAHPPINNQQDWENLLNKVWADAETMARRIEEMPEEKLWQNIAAEKYGNYYRNLHGIIEHTHYHLGQIVFLKKMIAQKAGR